MTNYIPSVLVVSRMKYVFKSVMKVIEEGQICKNRDM